MFSYYRMCSLENLDRDGDIDVDVDVDIDICTVVQGEEWLRGSMACMCVLVCHVRACVRVMCVRVCV